MSPGCSLTRGLDVKLSVMRLPGSLSPAQVREDRRQTSTPDYFSDRDTESHRVGGHFELSDAWAVHGEYTDTDADTRGNLYGDFEQETESRSFEPDVL